MVPTAKDPKTESPPAKRGSRSRWIVGIALVIAIGIGLGLSRQFLSLEYLAEREQALREWRASWPVVAAIAACLVYVAITGLSIPGAAILTLIIGWFFGFGWGLLIVSFSSTLGASLAFLSSRYLFRDAIEQRWQARLEPLHRRLASDGAYYLFALRLMPAVPFFLVNLALGLTRMRLWTFWWISQLGMLPGTMVYVYAGSSLPSLEQLSQRGIASLVDAKVLLAFAILGVSPWLIKQVVRRLLPTASTDLASSAAEPDKPPVLPDPPKH
ncbi:MAG: TVP38/TMEM64 family protein [Planctomycetales bacterium]|nr:TVP38/TMEM64 family protein [Planctomycetales bacterium]